MCLLLKVEVMSHFFPTKQKGPKFVEATWNEGEKGVEPVPIVVNLLPKKKMLYISASFNI